MKRGLRTGRGSGGFSMLELMMGITVLLVAVLTAMSTHITALNLVKTTRESNLAAADLAAALELVLSAQYDNITTIYPAGANVAAYTNLHLNNQRIVPTYPGAGPGVIPDPLTAILTCIWNDWRGRQRQMVMSSMRAR